MGCWKGDIAAAWALQQIRFFWPVSHFPPEKGTRRLVEIRNGNVKVSTYCIKFFQINVSIKLSMIFFSHKADMRLCMPAGVGIEFCPHFWHTWSNLGGQKMFFNQILLFQLLFLPSCVVTQT